MIWRSLRTNSAASSGALRSGREMISISATPVRLRSTKLNSGSMSWIDLPASCSMWMRSMRTLRATPGAMSTSTSPSPTMGCLNWLIW